ncbi:MAG TPA: 50S ribosomal protein L11 methyltransferase [Candidatus Binataceae bacterium]|nr:50S ribosomal protein L11 methyltransferase [Candidatus Binataceae bacterium]
MSLILDEHRQYLADAPRLAAFEAALKELVRPDHVVLDLASGSSILGMLAARAGARQVYSVEYSGMTQVARELCQANGLADRVNCIQGLSTEIELPQPADLLVADQIGRFGFEVGIIADFADARRRLLKPGAIIVPSAVELWVAPVQADEMWRQLEFWRTPVAGFDFSSARPIALNTGYPTNYTPDQLLAEPVRLGTLDLTTDMPAALRLGAGMRVNRAATMHGIGGWFVARLSPGVRLTNSPLAADRINRRNVFFPIGQPLSLVPEDRIELAMHIVADDLRVTWNVTVTDAAGGAKGRFRHSTWRGMLLSREDLAKSRPDYVPRLTPRGRARRSVLELCEEGRTLAEIESEFYRRHRELFTSPAQAAHFVAEVIIPYAR